MKASQVREMSVEDLNISLKDNFEALENFRFRHAIGQLENYKSISNTKKDIARIYTILKEKELKLNTKMKAASVKGDVKSTIKADTEVVVKEVKKAAKKVSKGDAGDAVKEVKKKAVKKTVKKEKE